MRVFRNSPGGHTWVGGLALGLLLTTSGCATAVSGSRSPAASAPAARASGTNGVAAPMALSLPNTADSLKFAVLGDFGTGERPQYTLGARMADVHEAFPFELTVLVGDNVYGSARPRDYERKFSIPYRPLLDAGVKFYASLGNHDPREQRYYEPFNMNGQFYYSFKAPKQDVRFFALDTTYMEPAQIKWLDGALASSREAWKIVFFHHPLYSSGGAHGSDERLRSRLEPLFVKHGVNLVLAGHDHIYERVKPQQGITHFVAGSGGKLRPGDAGGGKAFSARVVDNTHVFLTMEIDGDRLVFNAIAADGRVVDAGEIRRTPTVPYTTASADPG